jgi:hypothetical protein
MGSSLNFNGGLQIFAGHYESIPEDAELLFLLKEKIDPMQDYGILESFHLQQSTYFTSFRSFLGDFKIEVFYMNPDLGLIKIDEAFLEFTGKTVCIDLLHDDLEILKIWVEQILEFRKKHSCNVFCTVAKDSHAEILNNIFSGSNLLFFSSKDNQNYDSLIQIGIFEVEKYDSSITGAPRIYQELSSGWILQSGWRYFRSFKHPRDWKNLSPADIARDILGLPELLNPRTGYAEYDKWKNRLRIFSNESLTDNF